MNKLTAPAITKEGKAAVIGGGPAGMAAAYFLRRAGMAVTVFEKNDALGGVVRHVIPEFRIPGTSKLRMHSSSWLTSRQMTENLISVRTL